MENQDKYARPGRPCKFCAQIICHLKLPCHIQLKRNIEDVKQAMSFGDMHVFAKFHKEGIDTKNQMTDKDFMCRFLAKLSEYLCI